MDCTDKHCEADMPSDRSDPLQQRKVESRRGERIQIGITNEMPNVVFTSRKQIIQAQDVVTLIQQVITEMAPNESCSTCD